MIVSNTSTTESEVKVYQDIAKRPVQNLLALLLKTGIMESLHNVPEQTIEQQKQRFSIVIIKDKRND